MYYKRVAIIPYKLASRSGRKLRDLLRKALKIPILYVSPQSKTYQPRWSDYVINWGCSKDWDWINNTEKTPWVDVTNKLNFFEKVTAHNKVFANCQVNIPEWTTDANIVANWIDEDKAVVCARKILNGHSGKGLVLLGGEHTHVITHAPLYIKYKKKRHEYRVHFAQETGGTYKVIDVTQKKKRKGFEGVDTKIRNHQNGWVYCRENIEEPADLRTQALNAAWCSSLPFGAVDLIWNEKEDKCYVLEINSAPGIEGTTLTNYVNFFVQEIKK